MLNHYLTQDQAQLALEEVSLINNVVKTWANSGASSNKRVCYHDHSYYDPTHQKCFVVYKFFSTYGLKCNTLTEEGKQKLELASMDFLNWVRKFIQNNKIYFPYADTLFLRLIYCVVPLAGYMLKQKEDEDYEMELTARYIAQVKGLLEDVVTRSGSSKTGEDCTIKEGLELGSEAIEIDSI